MVHHISGVLRIDFEFISLPAGDKPAVLRAVLHHAQRKACELAHGDELALFRLCHNLGGKRSAGVLLLRECPLACGHGELALGIGVHSVLDVLFQLGNGVFQCLDLLLILKQPGLCGGNAGIVCASQILKLGKFVDELYLLLNHVVAGGKRLDLCGGKSDLSGVLRVSANVIAVHDLADEVLLPIKNIPQSGVKASLGNVGVLGDFFIQISLAESASVSLLHISGPPRCVQVVNGHNTLLGVHAHAHLAGRADEYSHLAVVHVREKLLLLRVGVRLVDKGNFLCRNPSFHQIGSHVVIELCAAGVKLGVVCFLGVGGPALSLGGGHVAEDDLRAKQVNHFFSLRVKNLFPGAFLILSQHILTAAVNLAAGLIGQCRVNHALGVGNLSPVAGDFQHVVLAGVYIFHVVRPLFQLFHIVLLELSRLTYNGMHLAALHPGDLQAGHLRQYVREAAEKKLQLVQIAEVGEGLLHAEALPAWLDLHGVDYLAELFCPCVESFQSQLFQYVRLQIFLHDVHFRHAVHYRRCGSERNASSAVHPLKISHLCVKVKCPLGAVGVSKAGDILHARCILQVFEVVRFVHKQAVNTELFKINVILVLALGRQLSNLFLQLGFLLFHFLYGDAFSLALRLFLCNSINDFIDLLLVKFLAVCRRHRDFFKLLIGENDRVKVSVGNAVCIGHSVGLGEALLVRHKQPGSRKIALELHAPLCHKRLRHNEHRLFHNAKLAQLHGSGSHLQCLPRANLVGQQGVSAGGNNALYRVGLVLSQVELRVQSVYGQVRPVILRGDKGVEGIVIQGGEFFPAAFVFPKPLLELLLDLLRLFLGGGGFHLVENRLFPAVFVLNVVIHLNARAGHQCGHNVQKTFSGCAPLLGVLEPTFQPCVI